MRHGPGLALSPHSPRRALARNALRPGGEKGLRAEPDNALCYAQEAGSLEDAQARARNAAAFIKGARPHVTSVALRLFFHRSLGNYRDILRDSRGQGWGASPRRLESRGRRSIRPTGPMQCMSVATHP